MRYEIMGPLQVVDGEKVSSVKARKVGAFLTILLLRSDQVVTIDQIIAEIWGEDPPRRVIAGVHVYISQIRKFLKRPHQRESPIITRPPGYMLRLGSDELDVRCFERLIDEGRAHAREHRFEEATASFDGALTLWRGQLLNDTWYGPILQGYQTWLSETRLECIEMLMDARLMMGQHRGLVSDLYRLTAEHPLREVMHLQLMLALYRSGRRADALHVYQSARRTLNEELGLEPCRELQALHMAILNADDRLELPAFVSI